MENSEGGRGWWEGYSSYQLLTHFFLLLQLRWLDRCMAAHNRPESQNLFGIVQGGLEPGLRKACIRGVCVHVHVRTRKHLNHIPVTEMVKRDLPGYAIGGLSGGEEKDVFWRIVSICTDLLPQHKPRYCMGVG